MQETPFIGSKTIEYPLAKYILKTNEGLELKTFGRPAKDQTIKSISKNETLFKIFNFITGKKLAFEVKNWEAKKKTINWEVKSDYYTNTYLECNKSESKAWFKNDGVLFYFTQFNGDMESLLYYFYLGTYKVALGFYKNLVIQDSYPLAVFKSKAMLFLQDFLASFTFL